MHEPGFIHTHDPASRFCRRGSWRKFGRGWPPADEGNRLKLFGLPSERLHENTSLVSLGLDSIRSVGLSRALRQHGYPTNVIDIIGNLTKQKLGNLCARSGGHSAQVKIDEGILSLQKRRERIKASFDPLTCKLSVDDEVEIFPTTALQAGMISQVCIPSCLRIMALKMP